MSEKPEQFIDWDQLPSHMKTGRRSMIWNRIVSEQTRREVAPNPHEVKARELRPMGKSKALRGFLREGSVGNQVIG